MTQNQFNYVVQTIGESKKVTIIVNGRKLTGFAKLAHQAGYEDFGLAEFDDGKLHGFISVEAVTAIYEADNQ